MNRDNTKWKLRAITNLCLFIFRLLEIPIGSKTPLPLYIKKNQGLTHLHSKTSSLCIFECLALFQKKENPLEASKVLCEEYTKDSWIKFTGITLNELYHFERYFKVRVMVYTLTKSSNNKIIAKLLRQSTCSATFPKMFVNLYENHFSFISNFSLFCKWLTCSICKANFKTKQHSNLVRHEKTCDEKVKEIFPGGIYSPAKTVFQKLEQIGIHVPTKLRICWFLLSLKLVVCHTQANIH